MSQEKKPRLGRGLDALFGSGEGDAAPVSTVNRVEAPLALIEKSPFQPRKEFDTTEIASLSDSIKTHGVLQPLLVRQVGDKYQLIAGERRLRAAEVAGLAAVPISIVDFNDQMSYEAALVENVQRTDLNPIEKASGFKEYLDRYQMTHDQLAGRLGLGRTTITNLAALLDLPPEVQRLIRAGTISVGHAKVLKTLNDPEKQTAVANEIQRNGWSVRATEAHIAQLASAPEKEPAPAGEGGGAGRSAPEKTAHVQGIEDELRQKLGVKVEVKVKAKDKGLLVLGFESNDDFERLLEALRK